MVQHHHGILVIDAAVLGVPGFVPAAAANTFRLFALAISAEQTAGTISRVARPIGQVEAAEKTRQGDTDSCRGRVISARRAASVVAA